MQVRKSVLILAIIAACLASYSNALFGDFVSDDKVFITANPYMKSLQYLPKFFTQDFGYINILRIKSSYYRPLLAASYMFDYTIWGNNPFGFHLTNLLFHIFSCILIFALIELLFHSRLIAFISTLLFSVHPIHTEAVSFISGRVDVVPPAFFLLSLVLFLRYAFGGKKLLYVFSILSFAIALLTKEMALTLPLIILYIDYAFLSRLDIKKVIKNFLRYHLGFFVTTGVYLIIRFYVIGGIVIRETAKVGINFIPGVSPLWRLFTVIKILTFHIRLLFFPYNLHIYRQFTPSNSLFEPIVLTGLVILTLLLFVASRNIKRYPIVSFSIFWFFITILPVSNILPRDNIFAERFLYIPSVGFCMGMGFLFSWLLRKNIKTSLFNWKKLLSVLFILLIVALGRVTYERNKVWQNDFTLWYDTAKRSPNSKVAHISLGVVYSKMNLLDRAVEEAKKAIEIDSNYYAPYNLLGVTYLKSGLLDQAEEEFHKVIKYTDYSSFAYEGLSVIYGIRGQYEEAIEAGLIALKKNPYNVEARRNLAICYISVGRIDEAINMYEEYLKISKDDFDVHLDIGGLYYGKGNYQKAREHWLASLNICPGYQAAKDALELLEN